MDEHGKNLKSYKSFDDDSERDKLPQDQRDALKAMIIKKYNVSLEESEIILSRIEKRESDKINKTKKQNPENYTNNILNVSKDNKKVSKNSKTNLNNKKSSLLNEKSKMNKVYNTNEFSFRNINSKTVDSILDDILPNYTQQVSVKLDHVHLTFEVQNEKIDTLKEWFIRTIKREKSKKIKIHALNGNIAPLLSLGAGFDYNFSGRKNIILNGAVLGYDKKFLESKIDDIIEFSELGDFIDIPIKNYSSGMISKLAFSIATFVNPDILIIDEILAVGDVNFQRKSADKIKSLMDGGTTVLLVSHSIPQIRGLCDKAIWIDDGRVRDIGEVNKVCDEYLKDAEKASNEQLANIELVNK